MRPDTVPMTLETAVGRTAAVPAAVTAAAVALRFGSGAARPITRELATEIPLEILFGGMPFGIMMATPADLEDFAYGFSLTEGVIARPEEIRSVSVEVLESALRLRIDVAAARLQVHLARRRAMTGRTSCGLCGVDDLAALARASLGGGAAPRLALGSIARALGALESRQALNAVTRAVHAAAWADLDGVLHVVREDVGRHNALDKAIGACLRSGLAPDRGFAVVTSRASFEMVEKVATFGGRTLVAISAPTALAVERARTLDVTLAAVARTDEVTLFHGADRIVAAPPAPEPAPD